MTSILIVGAGPTGLTLALAARARGLACRLIDKAAEPSRHSKALAIQARTLEVLERLGLAATFLAQGLVPEGLTLSLGGASRRIDFAPVHPRFPPMLLLPQDRTERLLIEAGAMPERGVELVGLVDGVARLRHPDGHEEEARADWIVGCDGAHSTVRHALGLGFLGHRYEEGVLLADARIDGLEPGRLAVRRDDGRVTAFFPMPGGRWRAILLPAPPEAAATPAAGAAGEEAALAPFQRPGLRVHDLAWASRFVISARQVERTRVGRALLAGDAAHIHSPFGGQGMNLGMQDAFALAAALVEGEGAVDRWATARHEVARRVLRATDLGTRTITGTGAVAMTARLLVPRLVAALPALRRRALHALAGLDYPPLPA